MNTVINSNLEAFEKITEIAINDQAIKEFVSSIVGKKLRTSELDLFTHKWNQSDALKLTLIFNAMNFCYWARKDNPKWSIEIEGKLLDGSIALVRLLEEHGKNDKDFLDWNYLAELRFPDFKNLFNRSNTEIPLIEERYNNLVSLAKHILNNYNGDSELLVRDGNAEKFLEKLIEMDCFKDESIFLGKKVYFWKRAQLEVKMFSDLQEILTEHSLKNVAILTAFADYKVPQILRHLNILSYSSELSSLVDSYELIQKDSKLENEIRISTIVAVERIKDFAKKVGLKFTSSQIDSMLWNRAASNKDTMKPYHRTYTIAY
jgi:hypothetical protein